MNIKELNIEKLKELWNKDPEMRKYYVGGAILALSFIYFTFIIIPQFVNLAKVSRQAGDLKSKIYITEDRINRINELKNNLASLQKQSERQAKHLPAEKEITILLESFAAIAKESNVRILGITPYDLKPVEGLGPGGEYFREMPIRIVAESGYHQLGYFVSKLENEKRVIIIDDLQIRQGKNNPRLHSVSMMLKTYVSLEE